jgi:DNA polymerase-3 subunit delta'
MPLHRLSELIEQPAAVAFLRGVVLNGRFSNAYLFHGPAGVGKGTAALAFARAILCERAGGARGPDAGADLFAAAAVEVEARAPLDDACDECPACIKSRDLQHPDLKFLFPVLGSDKELDDYLASVYQGLREEPFFVFAYEKAAFIRIDQTREILKELAFQPYEAARRVVVVRDADRMREDQYSAMLKSLEEPGAATVWVLTTSRLSRLPATIRSRCQRVRFAPLPERAVVEFLRTRAGLDAEDAALLAALSGGSLSRALAMRETNPAALRNQAIAMLESARQGNATSLWTGIQEFMRSARTKRETLRRTIEFQMLWLRDVLRAGAGAPPELLVHRDRERDIRADAARLGPAEIRRRLMVLEEALASIEGNVAPDTTLFSAMARMEHPGLGAGGWPAHAMERWQY